MKRLLSTIILMLGMAVLTTSMAAITRDAINRTFLKDGCYANGTVTANLLPLAMDIVPELPTRHSMATSAAIGGVRTRRSSGK
jgi:hypothetical protein